ncbi:hypothetical protein C8Q70DRAFT_24953 [Cubamyces menziesii]|nr:hypothetical protein C8Q70DRAFT_24953 [Cubamyces menziesii]
MVRTTACRHCSKLKLRCARPNNASPCDRCVESNLPCENPSNSTQPAAPAAASTRRSSCEQCRRKRVMCEKQGPGRSCFACEGFGYLCSLMTSPPTSAPTSAPTSPGGPAVAPAAQASWSNGPDSWEAGPSSRGGVQPVSPNGGPPANDGPARPDLSCDTTSTAVNPGSSPAASSRANSPRSDYWEVVLAPSPENQSYPEWSP